MKKIGFILLAITLIGVSCKTFQKAGTTSTAYEPALNTNSEPKVFSVPEIKETKPAPAEEKPIAIRKEAVTFAMPEDEANNEANNFFVIVGSFSSLENAKTYRQDLMNEGFTPIILHSTDAGYYRICVNSFKSEQSARARVHEIRQNFPKYYDSWLLIKQ